MRPSQLAPHDQVLGEDLRDPAFRAEWDRTAPARAVALTVLSCRTEHGLSQRALGELLGMAQPDVALLESGEYT